MKKAIVTLIIVSGLVMSRPITDVLATEISSEASKDTIFSQAVESRWKSTNLVVPSISISGKQISVEAYISPKKMTITTKGNLFLEKKEDNGWKIVSTWAINTTGTVNMVKNYRGTTGITYYPMTFIEDIDDNLKKQLYDGHYTYESSNEIFGIFTEDYNIEYRLSSDGNVIIDPENMKKFDSLIEKNKIVEKNSS